MSQPSKRKAVSSRVVARRFAACGFARRAKNAHAPFRPPIEGVEPRTLLSAPSAALAAAYPNAVAGQTTYTFTVDYTDGTAIDVATLGNNNLNVVGPVDAFSQNPTLVSYTDNDSDDPTFVQATYQFTAPGGAFAPGDGGDYSVFALAADPVADVDENPLPAGKIGDLNLAVQAAPSAELSSIQTPFAVGAGPYDFTIEYSDANGFDPSTFGNNNIEVDGPNGYQQVASYLDTDQELTSPDVRATYEITSPNDTFGAADVGAYTVSMLPYSAEESGVADTNGVGVPAGQIGTLNLTSSNVFPPVAALDAANPPTASAGQTVCRFVVDYSGGAAIDTTTLGNSNIAVTFPTSDYNTVASYVGTLGTPDFSSVQAIYQFNAPDGKFDSNDNGIYNFSILPYSAGSTGVADTSGNGVPAGYFGSFNLAIADAPPDTSPPTAVVDATQPPVVAGESSYEFTVDYSDDVGIDTNTISSNNLLVTGPNGFSQTAQYMGLTSSSFASASTANLQALYQIYAPDGSFGTSDNGTYTVSIQPYSFMSPLGVADTSGNGVPAGSIGTFALELPPASNLALSNVVYTPGTYTPGGVVALRATVTNTGNATASPFTISAGLSATGDFSQSIVLLTTLSVNKSLAPGQSTTVTVPNAAIPAGTTPGAYYFGSALNYTPSTTPDGTPAASGGNSTSNGNNGSSNRNSFDSSTPTIIVSAPTPIPTPAAIGTLNPNFGTGGVVIQQTGLVSTAAVAVQSNGKTVAVGDADTSGSNYDFGVTRFNADGSLDTTFGGTGTVFTDFGGNDQPVSVAIRSDGKIIVAGTAYGTTPGAGSSFIMARYNADGSLDTTFGTGGMVTTQFAAGSSDVAQDLQLLPSGQILIVGQSNDGGTLSDFALARYNADGILDTSFGTGGMVLTNILGGNDSANAVSIDPRTGDLLIAGSATNSVTGATDFALARYTANGALDATFSNGGKVVTTIGGNDSAYGVAITPTRQIVVVGATFTGLSGTAQAASSNFAVVRYNWNGSLDTHFGTGGILTVNYGRPALANQVQVNPDGSMLVAGATATSLAAIDPAHLDVALAEVTSTGRLDPTFGTGGKTILPLGASAGAAAPSSPRSTNPNGGVAAQVGGTLSDQAAATLDILSQQHAIATALSGLVVIVATNGSNTVEAQVVASSPQLQESLQTTLPASVLGGTKGSAVVKLTNAGDQLATGAATVTLYASLDNTVSTGDSVLATMAAKALKLKAHASEALKMKFAVPTSLSNGNYYIVAEVNAPASATGALTAGTAASSRTVTVQSPFVNLTAPTLATPSGLHAGSSATIDISLTNTGNVSATGTVGVQLFAAAGATHAAGDASLGTQTLKLKLKPGASQQYVIKLAVPGSVADGSYFFLADLTPALSGAGIGSQADSLAGATPLVVT